MHNTDIKVSVVDVVVDKKLEYFKNSFASLLQQNYTDFQFVVTIGYPGTETLAYLDSIEKVPFEVIRIIEPPGLNYPARATAQNLALNAATGNVILTTQDDIIFPTNWVSSHIEWHRKYQGKPILVHNRVNDYKDGPPAEQDAEWEGLLNTKVTGIRSRWIHVSGHSFSYTATDKARLREEYNGRWGFEDNDFAYQLHKLGYDFYFDIDTAVQHQPHNDSIWDIRALGKDKFYEWFAKRCINREVFRTINGFCPEYGTWKE